MRSFHSIAQHAKYESGHFYHYHLTCQNAIAPYVDSCCVYAPIDTEISPLPNGWRTWFHPMFNTLERKKFRKDCRSLFRQKAKSNEKRIFFLEYFTRRDFKLFVEAALLFSRKLDEFWILFRDDLTIRRKKERTLIYLLSKMMEWRFGKRFVPMTDSVLLANYYQSWFKKKMTLLPIPHTFFSEISPFQSKEQVICTTLGLPRAEKGLREICQLMKVKDPLAKKVTLSLSGATIFSKPLNDVTIKLQPALLSQDEYFQVLSEADVVLLPYDPYKYQRRTSGAFVETVIAGKLPLVKKGSWLAHELEKFHLSECIVNWENPLFFTHLFSIVNNRSVYEKLKVMQASYAQFHTIDHFSLAFKDVLQNSSC